MLNNKKFGIRLVALLLTVLMAAAMFAACTDKDAQAQAQAANDAAAAAQAAADSAAAAASDLAAQLAAANDAADSAAAAAAAANAAAASAQAAANAAQSNLNSVVSGIAAETTDNSSINYGQATEYVTTTILAELSQMKVKYLTVRYLWYTETNYLKLAKLFDDAYVEIYRATTADGVKGVLTKLSTDIAAIPSIASTAEAIQAQIKAFGEIDTDLFTTQASSVTAARAAYTTWLYTYQAYFTANGYTVSSYATTYSAIDAFALKTFGIAATTLRYAESKIEALTTYADTVSLAVYNAVKAVWGANAWSTTNYANVKLQSSAIEAAYSLYKIFLTANGGDGSLITYTDSSKNVITGEEFIKEYVLVLYDNWFAQYQSAAKDLIDSLPTFFMNNTTAAGDFAGMDTTYLGIYSSASATSTYGAVTLGAMTETQSTDQQVLNAFERIATLNTADFLGWTYSGSFKGTLSLEDAYLQIDNCVANAMAEMAQYYYATVSAYEISLDYVDLAATVNNSSYLTSTDSTYKTFDIAFGNEYVAAVNSYIATLATTSAMSYDQLCTAYGIDDMRIFSVSTSTNDVAVTYDNTVLETILSALNGTVQDDAAAFAMAKVNLGELKAFYDYRRALCVNFAAYLATMDAATDATVIKINAVRTAQGSDALTSTEVSTYKTAATAVSTSFRTAVMALSYNSYSTTKYQAVNADGDLLYYNKAAAASALTTDSSTLNKPLMIAVDKLVVAKDAATAMYGQYADQMIKLLTDLCRTQVNAYITTSVNTYKTNYASSTDSLNLQADINNYIAYIQTVAQFSAVSAFTTDAFSAENDTLAEGVALSTLTDYTIETVTANVEYLLHVVDYTAAVANVTTSGSTSYQVLADAGIDEYCALVTSGSDNVYKNLEKVRLLAFYKDDAIVTLKAIKDAVIGVYNTETASWTTAPTYSYSYSSSRKVRYLAEVEAVYAKLVAALQTVTMLDSDVTSYTDAVAKVDAVIALCDNATDLLAAADSKDDYSFLVAYQRYYQTNSDGSTVYDWSHYNAQ